MVPQSRKPAGGKHNAYYLSLLRPLCFALCGEQDAHVWEDPGGIDAVVSGLARVQGEARLCGGHM